MGLNGTSFRVDLWGLHSLAKDQGTLSYLRVRAGYGWASLHRRVLSREGCEGVGNAGAPEGAGVVVLPEQAPLGLIQPRRLFWCSLPGSWGEGGSQSSSLLWVRLQETHRLRGEAPPKNFSAFILVCVFPPPACHHLSEIEGGLSVGLLWARGSLYRTRESNGPSTALRGQSRKGQGRAAALAFPGGGGDALRRAPHCSLGLSPLTPPGPSAFAACPPHC